MEHLLPLMQWLLTYSLGGGFWHFVACWLILGTLVKVFALVRVSITTKRKAKKREAT